MATGSDVACQTESFAQLGVASHRQEVPGG